MSVSGYYADYMAGYLGSRAAKMRLVPLGHQPRGLPRRAARRASGPFTIGYFARIAPEKGLHVLAEAYRRCASARACPVATGGRRVSGARAPGLSRGACAADAGVGSRGRVRVTAGSSTARQKIAFPARPRCPVGPERPITSRRGFPARGDGQRRAGRRSHAAARSRRCIEKTGGGLLVEPRDAPERSPSGSSRSARDPALAAELGAAARGRPRDTTRSARMAEQRSRSTRRSSILPRGRFPS